MRTPEDDKAEAQRVRRSLVKIRAANHERIQMERTRTPVTVSLRDDTDLWDTKAGRFGTWALAGWGLGMSLLLAVVIIAVN
jgi:hypothetical protein